MCHVTRFARKVDANQKEIVQALRAVHAHVLVVNGDVDLVVFYRGRWVVLDVKNEQGRNRLTPTQKEMLDAGVPLMIVHSVEDALHAIGAIE
jgi:hypothetical protein